MPGVVTVVVLAVIAVASYTDLRKREVADWLNYGLIIFGLGVNALLSLAFWTWTYIAYSIGGVLVFFAIGYAMFYSGQWGGGDSKLMIGIGAALGLEFSLARPYINVESFLVAFWINLLLVGVVYALIWSVGLALKYNKKFVKEVKSELKRKARSRKILLILGIVLLLSTLLVQDNFLKFIFLILLLVAALAIYLSVFSKAVEQAGMLRLVKPAQLTEGDWIAKDIMIEGKRISGPKDLGVSKSQIKQLLKLYEKKKIKNVLIKVGIPFVPSFLIAYVLTLYYGNLITIFLASL